MSAHPSGHQPAPQPPQRSERHKVRNRALVGAGVILAFVLGVGAGASDPTASDEYHSLERELEQVRERLFTSEVEVEELSLAHATARQEAEDARDEAASIEAALEEREVEVRGRSGELDELEEELERRSAQVDGRESVLREAELAVAQRESAVETAEASVATSESSTGSSSSSSGSSTSSNVYFKNCDAARTAGAAPVYRGEPGYGRHLDRDNDGIGCE